MPARFCLNLDIVGCSTLDKPRYILGRFWAGYRYGRDRKIEVISVDPGDLVQRVIRIGNAVAAAVAHGI